MSRITPLTRTTGETENALRAVLTSIVGETPIRTYDRYVGLTVIAASTDGIARDRLLPDLGTVLGGDENHVSGIVDDLVVDRLVERATGDADALVPSSAGRAALSVVLREIGEVNTRLLDGIPAGELDASRRTLSVLLDRARAEVLRRDAGAPGRAGG